jgi:predicted AAA+ superfamily ATPase
MFKRLLSINSAMRESAFIFGPRGTGKTHWLKSHFPDHLYFDLLHSEAYTEFFSNPSLLKNRIPSAYSGWVIIDEIQRVPELLNEVHRLIEHEGLRFILTGSSARALRKKGVNLLAGRALTYHMHPLTIQELQEQFSLPQSLLYGTLPSVYSSQDPIHYLQSYVQTYLREEVQQEALTRNIALFTRFLTVASFSQGQEINYTNIAREVGVSRQTVANYFDILDDLLIATRLPVFTQHAKRMLVVQNKFYYFDAGVYRTLRPKGPLDSPEELSGAGLETLFLQHIRALNDYFRWNYGIYYWRTQEQQEVDFVLYGDHGLHAFEVKHKSYLHAKDFQHLMLFKKDYPIAKTYLLYGGTRTYYEQDILVLPFQEGLQNLEKYLGGAG